MDFNFTSQQDTITDDVLDGLFVNSDNVLKPATDEPKGTNVLENKTIGNVLDNVKKPETVTEPEPKVETKTTPEIEAVLDSTIPALAESGDNPEPAAESDKKPGRPSTDKSSIVSYLAAKIEANEYGIPEDEPYDSTKQKLSEYLNTLSEEKLHSLLDTNQKALIDEVRAQTPKEFFDSLPEELQYAAAYVAEGGQDMKALFKALSHVEEIKELDPEKDTDHIPILQSYLRASTKLTDNQITEQIDEWKEADKLGKKAKEFKPALDDMQKQQVEAHIRQANEQKKQQQELAQFYSHNIYKAIENNTLAGIKLDKRMASDMAERMLTTQPGPWSGRPVNSLGYGLEKAQYTQPDYEAVMLADWVLNDKAGFLEAMKIAGGNEKTEKAVKLIKMNQGTGASEPIKVAADTRPVKRIPNNKHAMGRN